MQKKGQPIRSDGPQSHIIFKTGTPTMGGLLIVLAFTTSTVLWAHKTVEVVKANTINKPPIVGVPVLNII